MSVVLPDDWDVEHIGESMILDREKVAAEIDKLLAQREQMLCLACGTITRDSECDCTRFADMRHLQRLVNYADQANEECREMSIKIDHLTAALTKISTMNIEPGFKFNKEALRDAINIARKALT